MSASVIKEFLAELKFKSDDEGLKKFNKGLEDVTKGVFDFAKKVAVAEAAIVGFMAVMAEGLDKLYFTSKRSQETVENIEALGFSFSQLGTSGDDAKDSLVRLANFIKFNPGGGDFLQRFGVDKEHLGNAGKVMDDLTIRFRQMADTGKLPQARVLANMLGIGDEQLQAMLDKDGDRLKERYHEIVRSLGLDQQDLAEKGKNLSRSFTDLAAHGEILLQKVFVALEPLLQSILNALNQGLDKSFPKLAQLFKVLGDIGDAFNESFGKPLQSVGKFIDDFVNGSLSALIASLRIVKFLLKGDMEGLRMELKQNGDDILASVGGTSTESPSGDAGTSERAMEILQKYGWTKNQAAGLVYNFTRESNLNPKAVGDGGKAFGIAQWHPDRQANFKKWAGKDIRNSSFEEQLAFANYELREGAEKFAGAMLTRSNGAGQAGQTVAQLYERHGMGVPETVLRGRGAEQLAATMNQTTTINVHGADAQSTAKAVAKEQTQVNNTMIRNIRE